MDFPQSTLRAKSEHDLAEQYSRFLHRVDNGEGGLRVVSKLDGREPENPTFQALCMYAHGDMMPDDWKYEYIEEALDMIAECEDEDQVEDRIMEIESDVYNSDLFDWLASSLTRQYYVDEASSEYGLGVSTELSVRIGYGQMAERQEVARLVWGSVQAIFEEMDQPDCEHCCGIIGSESDETSIERGDETFLVHNACVDEFIAETEE